MIVPQNEKETAYFVELCGKIAVAGEQFAKEIGATGGNPVTPQALNDSGLCDCLKDTTSRCAGQVSRPIADVLSLAHCAGVRGTLDVYDAVEDFEQSLESAVRGVGSSGEISVKLLRALHMLLSAGFRVVVSRCEAVQACGVIMRCEGVPVDERYAAASLLWSVATGEGVQP